ncbi:MAG: asparagine synthase (glutamine-hydrolyzing) [Myxococcales bacterium]|nr:asparagine synthase (glutamine-hydrolyzing) [Myxococcales bacterium]
MCGIAGILAYDPKAASVQRAEVEAMSARMRPRGPDGDGLWTADDGRVALAHRRLAIIDPDPRSAQPMVSHNGALRITFNGEIYNHRDLRAELEAQGHVFRTTSDTEVLLALYAQLGIDMVTRLRGMFAFGLWDQARHRLVLARDGYGIKPLYYANVHGTIRFASQVKALLASGGVSRERDPAGLVGLCLWGAVPEPLTAYSAIKALPAGSVLTVERDQVRLEPRFFSVAASLAGAPSLPAGQAPQELVREALVETVRYHLVADVPVGSFLSAGVDSSCLLGLMAELAPAPPTTATVGFDEFRGSDHDEVPLATQVAHRYGAQHHVRRVTRDEFNRDLPAILDAMDQPSLDGVNTWFASKAIAELGIKVAVSGLGGDELFGGYPSFRDVPRWAKWPRPVRRVPALGILARQVLAEWLDRTHWASPKLAGMAELGGAFEGAYLLRRGVFMPWELERIMPRELATLGLRNLDMLAEARACLTPDPGSDFARVAALEASLYMRNQLLRDTDWASMAHSIEVRVPLVDTHLLAQVAPLLMGPQRIEGKTWMAASPTPPLPTAIAERPKTGFATPVRAWLEQSSCLDQWKRVETLRHPKTHWSRRLVYALVARELSEG